MEDTLNKAVLKAEFIHSQGDLLGVCRHCVVPAGTLYCGCLTLSLSQVGTVNCEDIVNLKGYEENEHMTDCDEVKVDI